MDALYRTEILEHYRRPHHFGHLEDPDITHHDANPFCGDDITIDLKIADGKVVDAAFRGHGCAISQASASMLMDEIIGASLDDLKKWSKDDVLGLLGIEIGPVRLKCALLPLKVMKAGVWGLEDTDQED